MVGFKYNYFCFIYFDDLSSWFCCPRKSSVVFLPIYFDTEIVSINTFEMRIKWSPQMGVWSGSSWKKPMASIGYLVAEMRTIIASILLRCTLILHMLLGKEPLHVTKIPRNHHRFSEKNESTNLKGDILETHLNFFW